MLLTLQEIKAKVDQLAEKIAAPQDTLPTYGYSDQTGRPHIDIGSQGYYYLALERDTVCDRLITKDIDELLYKIFVGVTFELSSKYELANRNNNEDHRRIIFKHQVELLTLLSPQWGPRKEKEHAQILETSPFNDVYDEVSAYAQELKKQGISPEVRLKMIMEKFPPSKRY